jgi:hypothetical protein
MWKTCFIAVQEGLLTVEQITGLDVHYLFFRYADELTTVQRFAHIANVVDLVCFLSDGDINGIAPVMGRPLTDLPSVKHLRILLTGPHARGITALREYLLTVQEVIDSFRYADDIIPLLRPTGLTALREGLLSVSEAGELAESGPDLMGLYEILDDSSYGLTALREGLLTVQQAVVLSEANCLDDVLTKGGLIALRENLLTIPQMVELEAVDGLRVILCDEGVTALREGLLTVQQAVDLSRGDRENLDILLCDNGLSALRDGLYTPQQFIDTTDEAVLLYMVSDEGIAAHRESRSQMTQMDGSQIQSPKRPRSKSPE